MSDEATQHVGDFAVDEVGDGEFLVAEAGGVEVVNEEFDDGTGVDDLQLPLSSWSACKMEVRSTPPRTFAWVSRMTDAL